MYVSAANHDLNSLALRRPEMSTPKRRIRFAGVYDLLRFCDADWCNSSAAPAPRSVFIAPSGEPGHAEGIMASGHVNRAKRPNTWQHRPKPAYVNKALANSEPSTHGTKRKSAGALPCPLLGEERTSFDCSLQVVDYRAG
jgi:hypothetical protein